MAYRDGTVVAETKRLLAERPWRSLAEIGRALGVSRATIGRALRETGATFRQTRAQAVAQKMELLRAHPRSAKEVAAELGFPSPSAFAHYLRSQRGDGGSESS